MAQFIFYRILGNDLSPRHRSGQTLASLKFILKNEPVFPGVEKRWIVNRIVDAGMRNEIVRLLEKHKQEYRIIDFDRERFKSIPKSNFKARMDEIIGINAARNMALREGRQLGRWVLPFLLFPRTAKRGSWRGWRRLSIPPGKAGRSCRPCRPCIPAGYGALAWATACPS